MSVERMRRVDEAVREVLSDVLTHEVKDPRVGFVTVTDVKTSPDLSHARVYVSVLGDAEAVERLARGPAVRARLPAGPRRQRAAPQAHAGADLLPRRHRRARAAPGAAHGRAGVSTVRGRTRARRSSTSCATRRGSCSSRTRTPTATRSARWSRCTASCSRWARTRSCSWPPTSSRCPTSTASSSSTACRARCPPTSTSARSSSSTAATSTATRSGAFKREEAHILNIDHHHDNTRFGTVNHVVEDASCTAEIVWDLMRALGVEPAHGDRRGALRRPRHRHRQVHVREHRACART